MKYIAGGQDYKVLAGQFSEEVNASGGTTLGEAERTAGEKGQVEMGARGLGQTRGVGKRQRKGVSGGLGPFGARERDWAGPTHLWGGKNGKPRNRRAGHGSVGRPRRGRSSPPARPN